MVVVVVVVDGGCLVVGGGWWWGVGDEILVMLWAVGWGTALKGATERIGALCWDSQTYSMCPSRH